MLSVNFGILMGFILSSNLDYHLIPFIVTCLPIIYLIGCFFLPETPHHLLRRGKFEDAEKSFIFYNNCKVNEKQQYEHNFNNLKSNIKNTDQQDSLSYHDFGKYLKNYLCVNISLLISVCKLVKKK